LEDAEQRRHQAELLRREREVEAAAAAKAKLDMQEAAAQVVLEMQEAEASEWPHPPKHFTLALNLGFRR
jgi:hypothetical protein